MLVRLQKFLAEAGVASRRASEQIIAEGRVLVNGHVVRELGSKVDPVHDQVVCDGNVVRSKRKLYVALNKPIGCVCSRNDPSKRRTVYDLLPKEWATLFTVGRLDMNSEGLIFLTNDGEFSLKLSHPRYGIRKKYIAAVSGRVDPSVVARITEGIFHDGEMLKADRAKILKASNSQTLIELDLSEGKNREVRRLFEAQGLEVTSLKRVQIGPIRLAELPSGKWRTLNPTEIASISAQAESVKPLPRPSKPVAQPIRRRRPETLRAKPKTASSHHQRRNDGSPTRH